MNALVLALTLALLSFTSGHVIAGVWTSGGSELIKDSANPWFLQNTTQVSTCIIVDSRSFHTLGKPEAAIRRSLRSALEYWQSEFAKSWSVANLIHVATQDFVDGAFIVVKDGKSKPLCPAETKLTLQFGWLSPDQNAYLVTHGHRPGDLVAIAVRTDYDLKQMVAKGFIFVAGDEGPWAPRGTTIADHPWRLGKGELLTEVLKHELGHVFGLPHMGIEGPMAADYAERCLQKGNAEQLAETGSKEAFFKIDGQSLIRRQCYPPKSGIRLGWRQFLGTPPKHLCIEITLDHDKMFFQTGPDLEHLLPNGTLTFEGSERFTWQDAVRVYLPEGATAMACPDAAIGAGICPWLIGPMIKITDRNGTYVSADGKLHRRAAVTLSPLGLGFAQSKFNVEIDNQWHWNLDWEY